MFVGGFDVNAATALVTDAGFDDDLTIQVVGSLVSKCLVECRDAGGVTRYRLLETIRHFAAEHLEASGDGDAARRAHARHYLALDQALFEQLGTPADVEALEQLETETPNLGAAGRWLLQTGQVDGLLELFPDEWLDFGVLPFSTLDELGRLAADVLQRRDLEWRADDRAARYSAAMRALYTGHVDQISSFVAPGMVDEAASIHLALARTGELAMSGDMQAAADIMRPVIQDARSTQDLIPLSYALANLALFEAQLQHPEARAHAEEAVTLARATGSHSALLYPLLTLCMATQDDPERVIATAQECTRIDHSKRRLWSTTCQAVAALVHIQQGATTEGLRLARSTLAHLDWTGDHFNLSISIVGLADRLAPTMPEVAVQLAAIAESQTIAPIAAFEPNMPGLDNLGTAAEQVGPEALEAARSRTASMTYRDAIEFTLNTIDRLIETTDDPAVP